jgi:hypothetical protein
VVGAGFIDWDGRDDPLRYRGEDHDAGSSGAFLKLIGDRKLTYKAFINCFLDERGSLLGLVEAWEPHMSEVGSGPMPQSELAIRWLFVELHVRLLRVPQEVD